MLWHNINDLANHLQSIKFKKSGGKIYLTSGGFDPMHVGHLRCIQKTAALASVHEKYIVIIIVNGDGFLSRKKGYSFMNASERMEIISGIRGVDEVTTWDDGSQTVIGAIDILKPSYFTKGGDRSDPSVVPEYEICRKINCDIVFGVGGEKIQSSSDLISNMRSLN